MKDKTIIHVTTKRPHGGIGTVLKNIGRFSPKTEFAFQYVFSEDGKERSFDEDVIGNGNSVSVLPPLSIATLWSLVKGVYLFYKRNASHIVAVHVHTPNIAFLHFLFAKKFGVKVRILHSHSTRYSDNPVKSFPNAILTAWAKRMLTHRCACGVAAGNFLFGREALPGTFILHNAIATSRYAFDEAARQRKRQELGFAPSDILFGHVGNFSGEKNHEFLIDIFASLHEAYPQSALLLAGTGALEEKIRSKVRAAGLEGAVRFLGYRTDVPELLMAMDAFLFPSLFEGFPCCLVEAQCTGLPCFVANTVTTEVKLTNNVFFLPISSPDSVTRWKNCVVRELATYQRKDRSAELVAAGYDLTNELVALSHYYERIVCEAYEGGGRS